MTVGDLALLSPQRKSRLLEMVDSVKSMLICFHSKVLRYLLLAFFDTGVCREVELSQIILFLMDSHPDNYLLECRVSATLHLYPRPSLLEVRVVPELSVHLLFDEKSTSCVVPHPLGLLSFQLSHQKFMQLL